MHDRSRQKYVKWLKERQDKELVPDSRQSIGTYLSFREGFLTRKALRDMIKNPLSSQMGKPLPWDLLFPQIAGELK